MFHRVNRPNLGLVKSAAHPHDRMEERTPFHRSHVDFLQRAVDTLALTGEAYHLPLRDKSGNVVGYAQFKRVPNRSTPVLATVLDPTMKPGGENVEARLLWSGQKKKGGLRPHESHR